MLNLSIVIFVNCEYAKHTRVPLPSNNNRSSFPFFLVHNDIWGTHMLFQASQGIGGLLVLLMAPGYIFSKINLTWAIFFPFFMALFKISLAQK